jgi:hypothetical protein
VSAWPLLFIHLLFIHLLFIQKDTKDRKKTFASHQTLLEWVTMPATYPEWISEISRWSVAVHSSEKTGVLQKPIV